MRHVEQRQEEVAVVGDLRLVLQRPLLRVPAKKKWKISISAAQITSKSRTYSRISIFEISTESSRPLTKPLQPTMSSLACTADARSPIRTRAIVQPTFSRSSIFCGWFFLFLSCSCPPVWTKRKFSKLKMFAASKLWGNGHWMFPWLNFSIFPLN